MQIEPLTLTSPRAVTRTVFGQAWRQVAFVHRAVEPALVTPPLPPGTRPDDLDG